MSNKVWGSRRPSQYDAFISYSWTDLRIAESIQRALERIARPWYRRSIIRVVRDATTMSTGPDLRQTVLEYLNDSRNLIVIGSPAAARSPWVNREISQWLQSDRTGRILPVLVMGEWRFPRLGDGQNDDDADAAAPLALQGVTDEPRYLDLRWAQDNIHLSLRNHRFRDAIGELAAGILNTTKDAIVGEELMARRRNTRWLVVVAAVLVIALTGTVAATRTSRINAEVALSGRLASEALELRAQHSDTSPLLAAEAIAINPTPEAVSAGVSVLHQRGPVIGYIDQVTSLQSLIFSASGRVLIERKGSISTLDTQSLTSGSVVSHAASRMVAVSPNGSNTLIESKGLNGVRLVDNDTGAVRTIAFAIEDSVDAAAISADGRHLLLALSSGVVQRRNALSGSLEGMTPLAGFQPDQSVVSFSENGRAFAIRSGKDSSIALYGIDPAGVVGQPTTYSLPLGFDGVYEIAISPSGRYIAGASSQGEQAIVSVLDVQKRQRVAGETFPGTVASLDVSESPSGPLVATGIQNRGAYIWSGFGRMTHQILAEADVDGVALAPDSSTVVISISDRVALANLKTALLASAITEQPEWDLRADVLDEGPTTYVLDRDGVTANHDGESSLLPAANSTDPPGVLVRGRTGVELVALFGNRLRAYSVVDHVWRDLATNEPRDGPWTSVGTTSDHRFLVAKSERRLALLDGKTGQEKFSVSPDTAGLGVPASGNLDASGERFAWWSTQGGAVTVVELASGRSTQIGVQGMSVSDAAFLADGRLAVASPSGLSVFSFGASTTSTSWALPPDREPKILATDGNFLAVLTAVGSDQSQLLVFNNATGRPALDLDLLPGGPLRMIPGRRLTVVTFEKVVEVDPIWRDTQQLIRRLCASVSRVMTSAERERYLSGDRAKGCVA